MQTVHRHHPARHKSYKAPSRLLLKAIIANGALQVLPSYKAGVAGDSAQQISEQGMNGVGYALLNMKKVQDALEVLKLNTEAYPQSWNAWDSYAEACMNAGDKQHAIQYYQKSLLLNSGNSNGEAMLKKLQAEQGER